MVNQIKVNDAHHHSFVVVMACNDTMVNNDNNGESWFTMENHG